MSNDLDQVIIVDSDDRYISKMDKYKAHEHPTNLHQAVSVWLINDKNQVLLQKRSSQKIVGSNWWANTVCGNVRPTEIYSVCARRRLKEEIGVMDVEIKPVYKFMYKAYCNDKYGEYEYDQVFIGKFNGDTVLNESEVSEVAWIDLMDLIKQINFKINIPSPEQTLIMNLDQLKQATAPCEIKLNGSTQLLSTWTCMMLKDKRLLQAFQI